VINSAEEKNLLSLLSAYTCPHSKSCHPFLAHHTRDLFSSYKLSTGSVLSGLIYLVFILFLLVYVLFFSIYLTILFLAFLCIFLLPSIDSTFALTTEAHFLPWSATDHSLIQISLHSQDSIVCYTVLFY